MYKSYSPHWRDKATIPWIMLIVIIGLVPSMVASVVFFGFDAMKVLFLSTSAAWLTDLLMQRLYRKRFVLVNRSAIVTGLLVGLILPPLIPAWMPVLGSFIAIAIAKYPFGQGNSIFNPALFGRTFLLVSFPTLFFGTYIFPDGVTGATPLEFFKSTGQYPDGIYSDAFFGGVGGAIGETSAFAILIGGLFLIFMRIIDWEIPFFFIISVFILSVFSGQDPFFHILTGGLFFGAFFMATDYVTNPTSKKGKIIFALGAGILTFVFRLFSSYPEGVAFAILLMNALSPLIDRLIIPKPFGVRR